MFQESRLLSFRLGSRSSAASMRRLLRATSRPTNTRAMARASAPKRWTNPSSDRGIMGVKVLPARPVEEPIRPQGRSDQIPASVVSHRPSPDWPLAGNAVGVFRKTRLGRSAGPGGSPNGHCPAERKWGAPNEGPSFSRRTRGSSSGRFQPPRGPTKFSARRSAQNDGSANPMERLRECDPRSSRPALRFPNRNRPQALHVRLPGAAPKFSIGWGAIKNCSRSYVRSF